MFASHHHVLPGLPETRWFILQHCLTKTVLTEDGFLSLYMCTTTWDSFVHVSFFCIGYPIHGLDKGHTTEMISRGFLCSRRSPGFIHLAPPPRGASTIDLGKARLLPLCDFVLHLLWDRSFAFYFACRENPWKRFCFCRPSFSPSFCRINPPDQTRRFFQSFPSIEQSLQKRDSRERACGYVGGWEIRRDFRRLPFLAATAVPFPAAYMNDYSRYSH